MKFHTSDSQDFYRQIDIYLADQRLGGDAVLQGLRNNDLFEIFDEHFSRDLQTVRQFDTNSLEKLPQVSSSRSAIRGYLGVLKMFYHEILRAIGQTTIKPDQAMQLGSVEDSIIHLYDLLGAEAESDPLWIYFKCRKDHRDIQNAEIKSGPRIPFSMSYQGYYCYLSLKVYHLFSSKVYHSSRFN